MCTLSLLASIRSAIEATGCRPGNRVGLYGPACMAYALSVIACWQLKLCIVPLNTRLPADRLGSLAAQFHCVTIINLTAESLPIRNIPQMHYPEWLSNSSKILSGLTFADLEIDPESTDDASITLTSGSSGNTKGILHGIANHYYSAQGSYTVIPFTIGEIWLLSVPLYHISGLSLIARALLHGGSLYFPITSMSLLNQISKSQASHVSVVPAQLIRLIAEHATKPCVLSLKHILVGGAATPVHVIQEAQALNLPLHVTYGSTEMCSQITTTSRVADKSNHLCSGKALPYREVTISKEGEILTRGKTLGKGYATRKGVKPLLSEDGWYHTLDRGYFDQNDNLVITGRFDSMFISGGENIYPEEIEKALLELPGIESCLIVGIPHPEMGMRPVVFVNRDSSIASDTSILNHISSHLERFKKPDAILDWPSELLTDGKPNRVEFQRRAMSLLLPKS